MLDGFHHFRDVFGCANDPLRTLQTQRGAILEERVFKWPGVLADSFILRHRIADNFVLNVRDVHDVIENEATRAQPAAEDVLEREGAQIADMHVVVDGRSASVHAHRFTIGGEEVLNL